MNVGLDAIETAPLDELRTLQLERLQWSLNHAYANVEHYRAAFDRAGVHPADLHGLADLERFPFLVKDDLRRNYPYGMFAVPREDIVRIHASSGTTGRPTVVGYTAADIEMWAGVVARSLYAAEPWTEAMRAEIEARLGIDAVDIYGLSEVIGPGVAQECVETKDGPTVWEDHFVNVFPSQVEAEVLKVEGLAPHYQLEVDRRKPVVSYGPCRAVRRIRRDGGGGRPALPAHQEQYRHHRGDRRG